MRLGDVKGRNLRGKGEGCTGLNTARSASERRREGSCPTSRRPPTTRRARSAMVNEPASAAPAPPASWISKATCKTARTPPLRPITAAPRRRAPIAGGLGRAGVAVPTACLVAAGRRWRRRGLLIEIRPAAVVYRLRASLCHCICARSRARKEGGRAVANAAAKQQSNGALSPRKAVPPRSGRGRGSRRSIGHLMRPCPCLALLARLCARALGSGTRVRSVLARTYRCARGEPRGWMRAGSG